MEYIKGFNLLGLKFTVLLHPMQHIDKNNFVPTLSEENWHLGIGIEVGLNSVKDLSCRIYYILGIPWHHTHSTILTRLGI